MYGASAWVTAVLVAAAILGSRALAKKELSDTVAGRALFRAALVAAALSGAGAQYCPPGAATKCDNILILSMGYSAAPGMRSMLLNTGAFATVDWYNAQDSTPSLEQLAAYDAVLAYTFGAYTGFKDAVLMGDRLAAYHDQGGGVVIAPFANVNYAERTLKGAYGDPSKGYALFNYTTGFYEYRGRDALGQVLEPQSPLMFGVSSFISPDNGLSTASVVSGGVVVARYLGGGQEPLVVRGTRGKRNLVEINFDPGPDTIWMGGWRGDGAALIRNALKYSRCMPNGTDTSSTTATTASVRTTTTTSAPPTTSAGKSGNVLDPYSIGASGLQLTQAIFNLTASAWVIDVAYSKSSPDAIVAFFLPRAQAGPDGYYSAQFNSTFLPSGFPCSAADTSARAATTCCLPDFVGRYHVAAAFTVANSSGLACASPYSAPPALIATDSVSGGFGADMPSTWAAALPTSPGQPAGISTARITIGRADLRTKASRFSGQADVSESLDAFVGLAQFVPVPGSRILDSSASQIALSLVKSDYFTVAVAAAAAHTFLSYIGVRVHEVLDMADPVQRSQYASVSFALNADFQPNTATGLIPAASVRVGVGASKATANWTSPCQRTLPSQFAARLAQPCGPSVAMCAPSAAVSLVDRFASINLPLVTDTDRPLFDQAAVGGQTVFVELVVSAIDADGRPATTTLSASVPVARGGVATWCFGASASSRAEDFVDGVDLLLGSAGSQQDLARLQTLIGVPLGAAGGPPNATRMLGARSVEGGLLTIVLRGKDSYFGQAEAAGASLEIEDLASLHVTGDAAYAQVTAVLAAAGGGGFRIVTDQVAGRASLAPSAALASLCPSSTAPLPSAGCLLRYDIRSRGAAPGRAYEIMANQSAAAAAFMQGLMGGSDFAAALGSNFSTLLADKYRLSASSRARRAFWISPAVDYAPADSAGRARFALSQRVIVVALVHFVAPNGARRRTLLSSAAGPSAGAAAVAAVAFGTGLGDAMAARLGLPPDRVSLWRIGLRLTAEQACMAPAALATSARTLLLGLLSESGAASPIADVGIASSAVAPGGVTCGRRSATVAASPPTGDFETVIAFRAGPEPAALSAARLRLVPGIISVAAISVPAAVQIDDYSSDPQASSLSPSTLGSGGGGSSGGGTATVAGAVIAGAVAVLLAVAAGAVMLRRALRQKAGKLELCPVSAVSSVEGRAREGSSRRRRTLDAIAEACPRPAVAAV